VAGCAVQAQTAITLEEQHAIVACELNPERRAFYELCWHLGGSQGDISNLPGEDVDSQERTLGYARHKTDLRRSSILGQRPPLCYSVTVPASDPRAEARKSDDWRSSLQIWDKMLNRPRVGLI